MKRKDVDCQFYLEEIHKHYDYVLRYLFTLTNKDAELARDLTQDVMLKAWNKLPQMKTYSNVKSALISMAKNIYNDHYRSKDHTFATLTADESISEVAEPSNILVHFKKEAEKTDLARIFNHLGDEDVRILLLYDVFERSMIEVSQVMNMKYSTAVSRRKRALEKAKKVAEELNIYLETVFDDGQ